MMRSFLEGSNKSGSMCSIARATIFVILLMQKNIYTLGFTSHSPLCVGLNRPCTSNSDLMYKRVQVRSSSNLNMLTQMIPRGGAIIPAVIQSSIGNYKTTPSGLFNLSLGLLALLASSLKIIQSLSGNVSSDENAPVKKKPKSVLRLQIRFLSVFYLLRCADWLQGPYFYEVYGSKIFNGVPATIGIISKLFLAGFASTAIFGPFMGRFVDAKGRKKGTLAFTLLYAIGALSTKSNLLAVLVLGRLVNGIGTSLLFSAPEAWLVSESSKQGSEAGEYLGETFGLAYAGDSLVAILAGTMAGAAASRRGPTGPFELSVVVLALGAILASFTWGENKATTASSSNDTAEESSPTIRDAVKVIRSDSKILCLGSMQALFEASMYMFVLQWPPAMTAAIAKQFGASATPYGTIFSCLMTSCLVGSSIFGISNKLSIPTETSTTVMLSVATISMMTAALSTSSLLPLMMSFFAFEACVGMYFPSIGTLRSKYVPDSHRSVIMNLFGIPLNLMVVIVFLFLKYLGVSGSLMVSAGTLGVATVCSLVFKRLLRKDRKLTVASV